MATQEVHNWRLQKQRYKLEGSECSSCKERHFPPREICPECGDESAEVLPSLANIAISLETA
jgi:uncharacterized OB-fold protein